MNRFLLSCGIAIAAMSFQPLAAQVRWLETEHDFGAFDEDGGKVTTDFKFVNDGAEQLVINHVSSSCGCTVPEYSKKPIQPGDTAVVTAVYNPSGRPGRFSKALTVKFSNDSTERLYIKGVVIGSPSTVNSRYPVTVGAIHLRNDMMAFGSVKIGRIKSIYIDAYNSSNSSIKPTWSNIPSYLRITGSTDSIQPGEQGVYSIVLAPTKNTQYGLLTDSVTLNVPGAEPRNFEVAAVIEEDFSYLSEKQLADAPVIEFDRDMLDFGDFTPTDEAKTLELRITNKGKNDLQIRRIYTTDPGFTIDASFSKLKKGKSGKVKVTFNPSGFTAPLLNTRLQIISNDPERSLAIVRLVGIANNND